MSDVSPTAVAQVTTNAQALAAAQTLAVAKKAKAAADYAALKADLSSIGAFIKDHAQAFTIGGALLAAAIVGHIL